VRFHDSRPKKVSRQSPKEENLKLVNIPGGFATLIGALATFLAGLLVLAGAFVAWCSVQRQIRLAENMEKTRRSQEIAAIEAGFTAELRLYFRTIIKETSKWKRLIPLSQVNQNLGLAGQIRNGAEFEFFGRS
jgi:hypothetical protein